MPQRVLHITPSVRLLGARRSLLTLATYLPEHGFAPLVIVPSQGTLTDELDKRNLRWLVLRLPPWRKLSSWATMIPQINELRAVCLREKIDLVHCNEIYSNPQALVAASSGSIASEAMRRFVFGGSISNLRIPVVTHMRLSVTPRLIKNYFLQDATRIIAVSEGAARDFDAYPWKSDRVRVVHNGIEFEAFEDARARREETRRRLGYSPGDFIIGQIGLVMPRKRPRFVIESAPKVLREVPNAKFLFIGDASPGQEGYLQELKALADQLGVSSAFQFLPFQAEVADYFAACDVNLLLSNEEGFGRVVLEAAAAGVPTIGSRAGGIPELILDRREAVGVEKPTGALIGAVNASDSVFLHERDAFVSEVAAFSKEGLARELGAAAHERALQLFPPEKYVGGVADVFREALEDRTKSKN